MNRLLITQIGDNIRQEIKLSLQREEPKKLPTPIRLPDVRQSVYNTSLFSDSDRITDNPLYKKSLTEQAVQNMTRTASLSLLGQSQQKLIEEQIREDLQLPKEYSYLNRHLSQMVSAMVSDKDVKTKRKRKLMAELRRIDKQQRSSCSEQSRFSTNVEDTDLTLKLKQLVNTEGKLAQLHRRFLNKQKNDQILRTNLNNNMSKMYDIRNTQIDAINPLSPEKMRQQAHDEFGSVFHDSTHSRYQLRIKEMHKKKLEPIWESNYVPQTTKRWSQRLSEAKVKK